MLLFEVIQQWLERILTALTTRTRTVRREKKLAAAGNYAAGDVLSESATDGAGTAWYFPGLAPGPGLPFLISDALLLFDEDSVAARVRCHGLRRKPNAATEMDDNAAFAVAAADFDNYLGPLFDLPAAADRGAISSGENGDVRKLVTPDPDSDGVYIIMELLDAETNETAGMRAVLELKAVPA